MDGRKAWRRNEKSNVQFFVIVGSSLKGDYSLHELFVGTFKNVELNSDNPMKLSHVAFCGKIFFGRPPYKSHDFLNFRMLLEKEGAEKHQSWEQLIFLHVSIQQAHLSDWWRCSFNWPPMQIFPSISSS